VETKQTNNKKRIHIKNIRFKKQLQIPIIITLFILIVYLGGCLIYNNTFMANTTINGINVSHLSYQKVVNKLEKTLANQSLEITFIDGKKETLQQKDCGISYNEDNDIQKKLKEQNRFLWFMYFFKDTQISIDDLFKVDDKKYLAAINKLTHLDSDEQVAPVDAKVVYKDNDFSIVKEEYGSQINMDNFKKMILDAFAQGKKEVNVKEQHAYNEPKVLSTDKSLVSLLENAKKHCNASITYDTIYGKVTLDGNNIIKWLSQKENGEYYKDDDKFKKEATAFVKELAKKLDVKGKAKTFTGAQGELTVSGGSYGYILEEKDEVPALLKDIEAGKQGKRSPVVSGVQVSYSNGGFGDTFIEIDLSKQYMWFIKDGKVALESAIVSGLPSDPNKKTPAGAYYIYFMQLDRTLIGEIQEDGEPEYRTPVDYWMAFNGGIGLHDAKWQPRFGGDTWLTLGSHGCINLPLNIAAALYDQVKVNTPVICYY